MAASLALSEAKAAVIHSPRVEDAVQRPDGGWKEVIRKMMSRSPGGENGWSMEGSPWTNLLISARNKLISRHQTDAAT